MTSLRCGFAQSLKAEVKNALNQGPVGQYSGPVVARKLPDYLQMSKVNEYDWILIK